MNYKVLYRKYRPVTFADVVGQQYIVKTLENAIISQKINHAYLFTGPRGTGKTSVAKIFARTINCLNLESGKACEKCTMCLMNDDNPDIIELDAASNTGVDDIREIKNNTKVTPSYGKYKVYIIDEVHMLSGNAFNALLKTLEEPPAHVVFILATTDPQKIPLTVLSRCQRFDFNQLSIDEILVNLKKIAQKENIVADEEILREIAIMSDGGMRDALSMLDQIVTMAGSKLNADTLQNILGVVSSNDVERLFDYLLNNKEQDLMNLITQISEKGISYRAFVNKIYQYVKNKILIKEFELQTGSKLIDILVSFNEKSQLSDPYGYLLILLLKFMSENPKIISREIILDENSNISPTIEADNREIISREIISDKENTEVLEKFVNIRTNNCFAEASKKCKELVASELPKLLEYIHKKDKTIYNLMVDSQVEAASQEYYIFSTKTVKEANLLNNQITEIDNMFTKKFKVESKVVFLPLEDWKKLKKEYINNTQKAKKYVKKEEILNEIISREIIAKEKGVQTAVEKTALELFDPNKVVVK